jgi:hypothetical protein
MPCARKVMMKTSKKSRKIYNNSRRGRKVPPPRP